MAKKTTFWVTTYTDGPVELSNKYDVWLMNIDIGPEWGKRQVEMTPDRARAIIRVLEDYLSDL